MKPRVRPTLRAKLCPMSEAQRAACLSPEHVARLKARTAQLRAEGLLTTRRGVPNGWGSRPLKKRRLECIEMAEIKADDVVARLIEQGKLDKDGAGNEVLKWAVAVVLSKDPKTGLTCYTIKDQLAAAKIVLEYTASKPETKSTVKVSSAEGFLSDLLNQEKTAT